MTARVLLVDDNAVNRQVARLMLGKAGYTVVEARDGFEAVERLRSEPFDVVLMDIQMPRLNGYEATSAIRALEGEAANVPILAMTARAMAGDAERCLEAGMNGYVSKPLRAPALLAAVESWLNEDGSNPEEEVDEGGDLPVLRPGALDELRSYGGDEGEAIVRDLAETFMTGAGQHLAAMLEAFANGDRHKLERAAHTLKGSSGTLGAQRLEEFCRILEEAARLGEFPATEEPLQRIRREIDRVGEALSLEVTGLVI